MLTRLCAAMQFHHSSLYAKLASPPLINPGERETLGGGCIAGPPLQLGLQTNKTLNINHG